MPELAEKKPTYWGLVRNKGVNIYIYVYIYIDTQI